MRTISLVSARWGMWPDGVGSGYGEVMLCDALARQCLQGSVGIKGQWQGMPR